MKTSALSLYVTALGAVLGGMPLPAQKEPTREAEAQAVLRDLHSLWTALDGKAREWEFVPPSPDELSGHLKRYQPIRDRVLASRSSWSTRELGQAFYELQCVAAWLRVDRVAILGDLTAGADEMWTRPKPWHGAVRMLQPLTAFHHEVGDTTSLVHRWNELVRTWPLDGDEAIKGIWLAAEAARRFLNQCRAPAAAERLLTETIEALRSRAPWPDAVRLTLLADPDVDIPEQLRPMAGGYDDCLGQLLLLRGFARLERGYLRLSLEDLTEAMPHLEAAGNRQRLANVHHNLAGVWLRLGNFARAWDEAAAALTFYAEPRGPGMAVDGNGIFAMKKIQAQALLQRGRPGDLEDVRSLLVGMRAELRQRPAHTNADAYVVLAELLLATAGESSLTEFEELLREVLDSPSMQNHLWVRARMLQLDAGRHLGAGELGKARQALDHSRAILPEPFDVRVHQRILDGKLEIASGQPMQALGELAEAVQLVQKSIEREELWAFGGVSGFQELYSAALCATVEAFGALVQQDPEAAKTALPTFYGIVQGFHGYEAACQFVLARARVTAADLPTAERLEAEALEVRRDNLRLEIDSLQRRRATAGVSAVRGKTRLGQLLGQLEKVEGKLAVLPGGPSAPSVAPLSDVQRALRPEELLVEFIRLSRGFAALCIDVDGAELIDLSDPTRIDAALAGFASTSQSSDPGAFDAALAGLGGALLADGPFARRLRDVQVLLLSPEGQLARVPFAALPWEDGSRLGDHLIVCHVASGSVMTSQRGRPLRTPEQLREGRLLALANPQYGAAAAHRETTRSGFDLSRIGALPWTAREAVSVARWFAATVGELQTLDRITMPERLDGRLSGQRFQVLLGSHARESALQRDALAGVSFLHFACHGFADPEMAALSTLALSLLPDHPEEGLLRIDEFAKLRGDYELVALSACETGAGPIRSHDGPASLARAAQAIGARRVLATLWRVDDGAAHKLVTSFYRLWLHEGHGAAEALAIAQREARAAGVPTRDWAAFTLWGEPR